MIGKKKLLKQEITRNKKKKHKIVMLARCKLNSIENKISEVLINNQISHEDFVTMINEERNHRKLKEDIRMRKGQEDKKQILTDLLKYKTMISYCLKCKKNTESMNPKVIKTRNDRTMLLSKCQISNY